MEEYTYENTLKELLQYIWAICEEDMKASKKVKAIERYTSNIGVAIVRGEIK